MDKGANRTTEKYLARNIPERIPVLHPNEAILRNVFRGCAAYQLNWFDAHLWSYAKHYGLRQILTEDFQHDRPYGTVRIANPFLGLRP